METAKLPRDIVSRVERRWMLRHTQLLKKKLHSRLEGMQPDKKEPNEQPASVASSRETHWASPPRNARHRARIPFA
jgi:hypothetical protein